MAKGIIISGGGRYLLCALVNIRILRKHGCQLPIELWHFRNERLPQSARRVLESWDVSCCELPDLPTFYASKPWAVAHSAFTEVLVLDADNTPIRNPEYLFDTAPYQATGAVFWPDFDMAPPNEAWSKLAKLDHAKQTRQQESGQILIDRNRCRSAVEKVLEFNLNYDNICQYLWGCKGDKDTFQLAWYAVRQPFHMIPYFPGSAGKVTKEAFRSTTMVQHDTEGSPLFMHKNANKWHLVRKPDRYWDRLIFANESSGTGMTVIQSGSSHSHTHELRPQEKTHSVEAKSVIANLEEDCLEWIAKLRKKGWYRYAVFRFYLRDYLRKIFRKH